MPRLITANQFYNELIIDNIRGSTGGIVFNLKNINVTVNSKDSIGHMLQDWLEKWAESKDIYIRPNPATQAFPDFYLSESSEDNLLEIKSFDHSASPNFDIANFETYVRALSENPKKLDASYIIFGYTLNSGQLTIQDVWIKKIWEMSTSSNNWAIKLQVKQGTIYNIRPVTFTSTSPNVAQPFTNKLLFLEAIQDVLNSYPKTSGLQTGWLNNFKIVYQTATGQSL